MSGIDSPGSCAFGGVDVYVLALLEDVPLVELMCLVLTLPEDVPLVELMCMYWLSRRMYLWWS